MYTTIVVEEFDAAHLLADHLGKYKDLHGHTWKVRVELESRDLDDMNMTVDPEEIRKVLKEFLPDNQFLNEFYKSRNPTCEFLARIIYSKLRAKYAEVKKVTVWESRKLGASFEGGR